MTATPSKYLHSPKTAPTPLISSGAVNRGVSDRNNPRPHRGNLANLVALAMRAPQPAFEFYSGPPDPAGHTWHAFTLATPEEEAAGIFLRRYGRNPEFVFESRGLLLCGPVPAKVLP